MACEPLTYSGVDASKWACAKDVVRREYDKSIDSDSGELSQRGFTLRWAYDADQQTLQIQCLKKPWWAPCGKVNDRIGGVARKCEITPA